MEFELLAELIATVQNASQFAVVGAGLLVSAILAVCALID